MTDNGLHNELLLDSVLCGHHDILELDLVLELLIELGLTSRHRRVHTFFTLQIIHALTIIDGFSRLLFISQDVVLFDLVVPLVPQHRLGVEKD